MAIALEMRQKQQLALTPQLQHALKLLQLSALEFAQEMGEAMNNNPFIEEVPQTKTATAEVPLGVPSAPAAEVPVESVVSPSGATTDMEGDHDGEERLGYESATFSSNGSSDGDGDWTDWSEPEPTLHAHLREQLLLSQLGERDRALAHFIVDALDDDGYIKQELDELVDITLSEHGVTVDDLRMALKLVQTLDPPGIGARNLEECLMLQLNNHKDNPRVHEAASKIVQKHLQVLGAHELGKLQQLVGCDEDTLHNAVALIRSLDPKPGLRFGSGEARFVVPDVMVNKIRGKWTVTMNPAVMPRLRINRSYAEALAGGQNSYLTKQLHEARWLLRSMEQRFVTIQRVAEAIVSRQKLFFEYGEVAMKPMALKHVAAQLGVHESTVCRVTNNKFMATPRGVFEFKHFFSRTLSTDAGGAASATAVRALLKEMINTESPTQPLSDARLATLLSEQGLRVARRTITKYRTLMRVPSVEVRRALGKQAARAAA
ncbi:MAG TPA: RNA polymerase factor sigma-54 [Burkholderiales bacterium]|nr:RNA polymerase factor sigma-54 [Burkholderiales bacterium]